MKSIVLTGIRKMEMIEVPMPGIKKETDVLIRMKVSGVCGSDIHYYTKGRIGNQVVEYPFTVGHEGAGEVVLTGSKVARLKVGERVAIDPAMPCHECDQCLAGRPHTCRSLRFLGCPGQAGGCLSEYIVMPESCCFPIPSTMTYTQAAISEPLAIGLYAVRLHGGPDMKGKKIGILGFGPIGMSVMLAARSRGAARVYVTDKIDARVEIARKSGVSWAGNPEREDIALRIKEMEPLLLDAVFECCGQQEAMNQAVDILKPGGRLMIIGIPEFDYWSIPVSETRHKEISVQNVRRQNNAVDESLDLLHTGKIDVNLMPTHRFPFGKTMEAFELAASYGDGVMKAMIDF
jgi:L-iditol 2-dehydrogenase